VATVGDCTAEGAQLEIMTQPKNKTIRERDFRCIFSSFGNGGFQPVRVTKCHATSSHGNRTHPEILYAFSNFSVSREQAGGKSNLTGLWRPFAGKILQE
jgi:hypothetical protein